MVLCPVLYLFSVSTDSLLFTFAYHLTTPLTTAGKDECIPIKRNDNFIHLIFKYYVLFFFFFNKKSIGKGLSVHTSKGKYAR